MSTKSTTKSDTTDDVRGRIVAGALVVLRKEGVLGLTQPRVAKAARVRQSHLTYYFPTRRNLLVTVFEAVAGRLLDAFATSAPRDFSRIATPEQTRLLLALVLTADREPAVRDLFRVLTTNVRRHIAKSLAAQGIDADASAVAMLHALGVGLAVLDLARQEPGSRRELKTSGATALASLKRKRRKP